ncbi:MAG: hypothetical protein WAW96_16015 [Alphaproteobacteria bacterium]
MGDVIITVHGTGDSEILKERMKWWQPGSPFERELLPYLGIDELDAHFEPFIWSGANLESHRRKAAKELLSRLKDHEAARNTYHIIGHSHGGSVINEAMMIAADSRRRLSGLRSITSIGTPFIDFVFKRVSLSTVLTGMFGWPVTMFAVLYGAYVAFGSSIPNNSFTGPLLAFLRQFKIEMLFGNIRQFNFGGTLAADMLLGPLFPILGTLYGEGGGQIYARMLSVLAAYLAICALFGPLHMLLRVLTMARRRRPVRSSMRFGSQALLWQCFWHSQDEAVGGLHAAKQVNLQLFRTMKLSEWIRAGAALVAFSGAVALGVMGAALLMLSVLLTFTHGPQPRWLGKMVSTGWQSDPILFVFGMIFLLGLVSALMSPVAAALAGLIRRIADGPARHTLGALLDLGVAGTLRGITYGLDVPDEKAHSVYSQPPFVKSGWRPLPEPIRTEMADFVNKNAVETVSKLRELLGSAYLSRGNLDVLGSVRDQLNWNELLHTSYFVNERLVRLIAYGMLRVSGKPPSGKLKADPNFPEIEQWYAHVSGEGPAIEQQTSYRSPISSPKSVRLLKSWCPE